MNWIEKYVYTQMRRMNEAYALVFKTWNRADRS